MNKRYDTLIIGGGMAYTFLSALGHKIGNSLFDETNVEEAFSMVKTLISTKFLHGRYEDRTKMIEEYEEKHSSLCQLFYILFL